MIELDCCKKCKYKLIAENLKNEKITKEKIISYYVIAIDSEFYDDELMYYTINRSWIHDIDYADIFYSKEWAEHEIEKIKDEWKDLDLKILNVCKKDTHILFTAEV